MRVSERRRAAALVSIALVAATLEPILRSPGDDGFPLSTYPMFATPRATKLTLDYAIAETRDGARRSVAPELVGSSEVLQALANIAREVAGKRSAALCERIARGVAADSGYADVTRIRIVTGTNDAIEYLAHGTIGFERERARCQVLR